MEIHPYPGKPASVLSPGPGVRVLYYHFLILPLSTWNGNLTVLMILVIVLETQSE